MTTLLNKVKNAIEEAEFSLSACVEHTIGVYERKEWNWNPATFIGKVFEYHVSTSLVHANIPIVNEHHPKFSKMFSHYNARIEAYYAVRQHKRELRYYPGSKTVEFCDKAKGRIQEFDGIVSENGTTLLLEVKYRRMKNKQSSNDDVFSHVKRKLNTLQFFYPSPEFVGIVNGDYYDHLGEQSYSNLSIYHSLRLGDSLCKMRVDQHTIFHIQEYLRKKYPKLSIDILVK